jgi:filamentous hemagglutinin family protein
MVWYSKNRATKYAIVGMTGMLVAHLLHGQLFIEAEAQVPPPPITSSGLKTQVSAPVPSGGTVQYNITGGTRPNGGTNLFHSFGEFGVPTNNIANFLNDAALPTTNILSRVTGGHPSNILGKIQTDGFEKANLFLMNPAGIVFGPNASLDVGGSTHFTTADYLRLSDGVQFTALSSAQDSLLSVAPVAAFGFLGNNPGTISVDGSTLSVEDRLTLSLVGGDITIGGGLSAPGGKIAIASVASPGDVLADTFASAPNVNGESFTTLGKVTLSEGGVLDVSNEAAGTVMIRGGQLTMINALISSDTGNVDGAPFAIDIDVTGDISASTNGRAFTARTTGFGNAGETKLASGGTINISGAGSPRTFFPIFDTHTTGSGNGGNISITSQGGVTVTGDPTRESFVFFADTGTDGFDTGKGGDVSITAQNFESSFLTFSTGSFFTFFNGGVGAGHAGNVNISVAGNMNFFLSEIITDSFDVIFETGGNSGAVTLNGRNINFDMSKISTSGRFRAGNVTLNADNFTMENSLFETITRSDPGGVVSISGKIIDLSRSSIVSTTSGNADAGDLTIVATERLSLLNPGVSDDQPSSIASNSFGSVGEEILGAPGNILITTPVLTMDGGSKINSSSGSSGTGGNILINAEKISMSGQTNSIDVDDLRNFGNFQSTGIFTNSLGGNCAGPCGDAGGVAIKTNSIVLEKGAQINSSTSTKGKGGTITVNASGNISLSGTLKDGTPGGVFSRTTGTEAGSGGGGAIALTAGQNFTLSDGATVSASSSGQGDAGNINITGHDTILIDKATVTTEATQASGGEIKLTANDTIQLVDSTIESTVKGDARTVAGNIELDPDFIILQNSHILAKAVDGQGGNIKLIASKGVLVDAQSTLEVTSERGISGTVNIESPIQVLSGTIVPLPDQPVNVATLYAARCVAGEGGHFSTFVDSKSDSVAPTPGTFLASPFLPQGSSSSAGASGDAGTRSVDSGQDSTPSIQLAAYSPPVLFQHGDGMLSACP